MKSGITAMNNIHWKRIFSLSLPISILLLAQACHGSGGRLMSTQSTVESSVNYPLNRTAN
ncbi:hypothetical protein ACF3DV_18195 [Chlorogloeopsis fritschii PCC 9212]|uniref:Uncharacterized protein n=2 Tax=Chlorogloeopsis fritschii TaxID=1124 RepID=A0A3S5K224_CHLFR|nr:hypothetical protein [Chlorogloeopsis fritschii]RUR81893.1 hypothetical protein PCC6912_27620 [Chlorogloeopsis fritschii PCC 6912]